MGLFSDRRRTVVGTTVSRVIQDSMLPNAARTGLTRALLSKDGEASIPDYAIEEVLNGMGIRAERMFNYAKDNYTYGIPSAKIYTVSEATDQVQGVLDAIEGQPVNIEYSQFGPPNLLHLGWMRLISNYGYNPDTNELTTIRPNGNWSYLGDMQVVIPDGTEGSYEPGALDQYGIPPNSGPMPGRSSPTGIAVALRPHSPVILDSAVATESIRILYVVNTYPIVTDTLTFSIDGLADETADYFHVKYKVGSTTKYWMYKKGLGTYPILDALFDAGHTPGTATFFPWTYMRFSKVDQANPVLPHYTSTKRMLKTLGMDYDDVADAINENPDIADVDQAILMMAVPVAGQDQMELRYLFDFFSRLQTSAGTGYNNPRAEEIANIFGNNAVVMEDARTQIVLTSDGIYKKLVRGQIGAVGHYTGTVEQIPFSQTYFDETSQTTVTSNGSIQGHVYRKQITETMYEQIDVLAMRMYYKVLDGYYTTADETDNILMIPVDQSITTHYNIPDRELLYARSLHFVFNCVQIVKIKWYQQSFFQFLMIAISVFLIVYSLGTSTALNGLIAGLAAGATAAVGAALLALAIEFVIGALIGYAFKILVKAIGVELAFLVAIVAAVASFGMSLTSSSTMGVPGAPWANQLLQLSSGLVKGIQSAIGDLMEGLSKDAIDFKAMVATGEKELEKANALLENRNYLDPFVIFGESPGDYFNRTVHSGNIGIAGISAISSYVDIALTLPKLNDTLGDEA